MSGGIAYILDETGDFTKRCNGEMVELERIHGKSVSTEGLRLDDVMTDMLTDDAQRIYYLVEQHLHYTNSSRAKSILADWDNHIAKFLKVVPIDYKRALTDMRVGERNSPRLHVAAGN